MDQVNEEKNTYNMKIRRQLLLNIKSKILEFKETQVKIAKRLNVTQPRVNDLIKEKIEKFSLDALVNMADNLDFEVCFSLVHKES